MGDEVNKTSIRAKLGLTSYHCKKKLISLNLSVKDDDYDTRKTTNIKTSGGEVLLSDQYC
jgi:uncharacterized ubiquitin-like protein YukD